MSSPKPPVWVVLKAHFRASPRKTGILVVLFVVMGVLYARWFLSPGTPGQAEAAQAIALIPRSEDTTGKTAHGDTTARKPPRITLEEPLARELTRNPFALDLEQFPLVDSAAVVIGPDTIDPRPSSGDPGADMRAALSGLTLQATYCYRDDSNRFSADSLACINGYFLGLGDEIAGFVVKRIEPNRVMLRYGQSMVVLELE